MNVITSSLGTFFTFNYKEKAFKPDYVASILFNVMLALQALFLTEINFSGMILNSSSKSVSNEYVNLICATEIRWQRMIYYFAKIIVLVSAFFLIAQCKEHMRLINQYCCILSRQLLPQHLNDTVVRADITAYEGVDGILHQQVYQYARYKAISAALYSALYLPIMLIQYLYKDWREIVIPDAIMCDNAMAHFNRERHVDIRCHLNTEWEAFVTAIVSEAFAICFLTVYVYSVFTTLTYLRDPKNFRLRPAYHNLTPGHANDVPDMEGAIAGICRIAREMNPDLFVQTIQRFDGIVEPARRGNIQTASGTPPPPPDEGTSLLR